MLGKSPTPPGGSRCTLGGVFGQVGNKLVMNVLLYVGCRTSGLKIALAFRRVACKVAIVV